MKKLSQRMSARICTISFILIKRPFLTRMSNPNYWSKEKLAIMDEWREGNFEVEDPIILNTMTLKKYQEKKHLTIF